MILPGRIIYGYLDDATFSWQASDYVLVLEICDDGTAGDFYIVYNGAERDSLEGTTESHDEHGYWKELSGFPFAGSRSTVARVKDQGLGLLKCRPREFLQMMRRLKASKDGIQRAQLNKELSEVHSSVHVEHLSVSKPEIVLSGIRESGVNGTELVGLYDEQVSD